MVMEQPAPQSTTATCPDLDPYTLGREFVRQYYTMLNQAPQLLHKFYSEDSSLVHGSQNDAVYGLQEINQRFLSLSFHDCHAKIRQVDSLETLEKGVVVQVTGELSNNGQQMRRFFQTIVLAPKSPTNYYVRNDIFRYQDEIFFDEEDASSEMEKTEVEAPPPAPLKTKTANSAAPATPAPPPTVETAVEPSPKQINGHPEEKAPAPSSNEPMISRPAAVKESSPAPKQRLVETAKLSWASRVADSSHAPSASQITVQKMVDSPVIATVTSPVTTSAAPMNKSPKDPSKRPPRGQKKFEKEPSTTVESDGEEMKKPVFADDQQVFVGNLPQDITEDELKAFFSSFGTILDVRINRTNQKSGAGRTPNYGFVTFDNPNVVKKILNQKPIYFKDHRFNVEEKRSQGRQAGPLNRSGSGAGINSGGRGGGFAGKREDGGGRRDRREGQRDRVSFGDRPGGEGKKSIPGGGGGVGSRPAAKR